MPMFSWLRSLVTRVGTSLTHALRTVGQYITEGFTVEQSVERTVADMAETIPGSPRMRSRYLHVIEYSLRNTRTGEIRLERRGLSANVTLSAFDVERAAMELLTDSPPVYEHEVMAITPVFTLERQTEM